MSGDPLKPAIATLRRDVARALGALAGSVEGALEGLGSCEREIAHNPVETHCAVVAVREVTAGAARELERKLERAISIFCDAIAADTTGAH